MLQRPLGRPERLRGAVVVLGGALLRRQGAQPPAGLGGQLQEVPEASVVAVAVLDVEGRVHHPQGAHAGLAEELAQGGLPAGEGLPAHERERPLPQGVVGPGGHRGEAGGVVVVEDGRPRRQAVQVGRAGAGGTTGGAAVRAKMVPPEGVGDDQHDVLHRFHGGARYAAAVRSSNAGEPVTDLVAARCARRPSSATPHRCRRSRGQPRSVSRPSHGKQPVAPPEPRARCARPRRSCRASAAARHARPQPNRSGACSRTRSVCARRACSFSGWSSSWRNMAASRGTYASHTRISCRSAAVSGWPAHRA